MERAGKLEQAGEDIAVPADFHLVLPVFVNSAFAFCSAEKPAELSRLKFPGRTDFFAVAFFLVPAVFLFGREGFSLINQQEVDMSLNVERNGTPPLLIALDGF